MVWYSFWALLLIISLFSGLKKSAKGITGWGIYYYHGYYRFYRERVLTAPDQSWPYFREKPSAPYIMLFMILLLSCAFPTHCKAGTYSGTSSQCRLFLARCGRGNRGFYQLMKKRAKKNETPERQTTENQEKT